MKKGAYWEYAKELKKITNTPVMAQGGITCLEEGENILKNKQGDFWGMAQALIADPQLVTKTIENREDEIYNCLAHLKIGSCHRCRYLKQKNLDFACVTPGSWTPDLTNKVNLSKRNKDIDSWKKIIKTIKT